MILTTLSVVVSDLTRMIETANPIAAASATSWPGSTCASPGRTITTTPTRPSKTAPIRAGPRRSPRKPTASSAVHTGLVNSIATTCAIGIMVKARNQPNWAP